MPDWLTDSQTLKDSATQLLKKYKSGALVTQLAMLASQGIVFCLATNNSCIFVRKCIYYIPSLVFVLSQIEREFPRVSARCHLMFAAYIPTGVQSWHQILEIIIKLLMLFIPALLNTRMTTLTNLVVHQMAASSKTKVQQRRIAPKHQIVSSLSPSAVKRIQVCWWRWPFV